MELFLYVWGIEIQLMGLEDVFMVARQVELINVLDTDGSFGVGIFLYPCMLLPYHIPGQIT